jgi:hypothetical protein
VHLPSGSSLGYSFTILYQHLTAYLPALILPSFARRAFMRARSLSPPCPVTGGNQQHKALIDEVRADATKLTPGQAAAVKALWADAGIQVCAQGNSVDAMGKRSSLFLSTIRRPFLLPRDWQCCIIAP